MKHVTKGQPVPEFEAWKVSDDPNWAPGYGDLQNPQKRKLHESLLSEQGWVCCYCGRQIQAERAGWKSWTPGARLGASQVSANRPDAIGVDPQMQVVAVEVERTIKTTKRYEAILSHYLQAVAKGQYARIVWVCPNEDLTARLRRIVLAISAVPVNGKRIALEQRHYELLSFVDYADWSNNRYAPCMDNFKV